PRGKPHRYFFVLGHRARAIATDRNRLVLADRLRPIRDDGNLLVVAHRFRPVVLHLRGLVVVARLLPVVPDPVRLVLLDLDVLVLLGVQKDLLGALLVLEANLIEVGGAAALARA